MELKEKILENKKKLIVSGIVALVLTGSFGLLYSNKFTNASENSETTVKPSQANNTPVSPYNQYANAGVDNSCPIKAKKKSTGKSYYHVPGDLGYSKIKKPTCFQSEEEAIGQGFVKSPR